MVTLLYLFSIHILHHEEADEWEEIINQKICKDRLNVLRISPGIVFKRYYLYRVNGAARLFTVMVHVVSFNSSCFLNCKLLMATDIFCRLSSLPSLTTAAGRKLCVVFRVHSFTG